MTLTPHQRHHEHDLWHIDVSIWLGAPSFAIMSAVGLELNASQQAKAEAEERAVIALQEYAAMCGVGLPRGDG